MSFAEGWELYEEGELSDFAADDPDEIVATAARTVDLELMIDAAYDPITRELSNLEVTSAEEA